MKQVTIQLILRWCSLTTGLQGAHAHLFEALGLEKGSGEMVGGSEGSSHSGSSDVEGDARSIASKTSKMSKGVLGGVAIAANEEPQDDLDLLGRDGAGEENEGLKAGFSQLMAYAVSVRDACMIALMFDQISSLRTNGSMSSCHLSAFCTIP